MERQITHAAHGHILTNVNVWSRDSRRIVYDVRSDPAGDVFDGDRIETVDVETGEVCVLFASTSGAKCGVATFDPTSDRVAFILGPEFPTPNFDYGPTRRRGVIVDEYNPGIPISLDARDLSPPFTPGALRGGSHVHVFSPDGSRVSFTYEDHILATGKRERNQRNVGVSVLNRPTRVPSTHFRNHDGSAFSVLVTRTTDEPRPGSDEIARAFEDAWVANHNAIAFQGQVVTKSGAVISEVFIVDLPDDLTIAGDGPLEGTLATRPRPPRGCVQRRLTRTETRQYPGIQGPRHWLRSSPDGSRIAVLMRDDAGIVQIWSVDPQGNEVNQITHNQFDIQSAFTWSPNGRWIAYVMDERVHTTAIESGQTIALTERASDSPRPEACVWSPNGQSIAFTRNVAQKWNQIHICEAPE